MSVRWSRVIPHLLHDVRALVRKTSLKAQLLERQLGADLPPDAKTLLDAIFDAQAEMNRLTLRVAALSDADSRGSGTTQAPLTTIVLSAKIRIKPELEQVSGKLDVGPLPECSVPEKLDAVLFEILDNSIRFYSADRPLSISLRAELSGDDQLTIAVSDNGTGWPADSQGKLFEPFQSLALSSSTTTRKRGGGLGLPIAQALLESMGGAIRGELLEEGARFTITLPVSEVS